MVSSSGTGAELLRKYSKGAELGKGAFGVTHLGVRRKDGKEVAIKVMT